MPEEQDNKTEAEEVEVTEKQTEEPQEGAEEKPEGDENEKKVRTPEEYEAELKKVRAEAAARRVENKDLLEKLGAAKTPEEVQEVLDTAKAEAAEREHGLLVENVALKFGLPEELAEVLHGDTREELEAHAKKLQKFAPTKKATGPLKGGLNPDDDHNGSSAADIVTQIRTNRY